MTDWYSPTWYELFIDSLHPAQTHHELAFLAGQLPNPPYHRLLDVACGPGRHAYALAERGYQVMGIDLNPGALAQARRHTPDNPRYLEHDMRQVAEVPGTFDAIVCLWQSFGYFEPADNLDLLKQWRAKLNRPGRLVLDIYHRGFFEHHLGQQRLERQGRSILETKTMAGHRLRVRLDYGLGDPVDVFEWQLYTPEEICALGASIGLEPRLTCTQFDPAQAASPDQPRMQIVFET